MRRAFTITPEKTEPILLSGNEQGRLAARQDHCPSRGGGGGGNESDPLRPRSPLREACIVDFRRQVGPRRALALASASNIAGQYWPGPPKTKSPICRNGFYYPPVLRPKWRDLADETQLFSDEPSDRSSLTRSPPANLSTFRLRTLTNEFHVPQGRITWKLRSRVTRSRIKRLRRPVRGEARSRCHSRLIFFCRS